MIDEAGFQLKKEALALAETYVGPICEKYPLEKYNYHSGPTTIVSSSGSYVMTPAEQNADLLIKLASWLVTEE